MKAVKTAEYRVTATTRTLNSADFVQTPEGRAALSTITTSDAVEGTTSGQYPPSPTPPAAPPPPTPPVLEQGGEAASSIGELTPNSNPNPNPNPNANPNPNPTPNQARWTGPWSPSSSSSTCSSCYSLWCRSANPSTHLPLPLALPLYL